MVWGKVPISFFCMWISSWSSIIYWKILLFPLHYLGVCYSLDVIWVCPLKDYVLEAWSLEWWCWGSETNRWGPSGR
jgi:hypothetical protein